MSGKLIIRTDIGIEAPRGQARFERDGRVAARLLAIDNELSGISRAEAARTTGKDRQTLRDWMVHFNAGGLDGVRDRKRPDPNRFWTKASRMCCAALSYEAPIRIATVHPLALRRHLSRL
jgi:hypothetical protein